MTFFNVVIPVMADMPLPDMTREELAAINDFDPSALDMTSAELAAFIEIIEAQNVTA